MYFDALMSNPRLPFFVLEELVSNPARRQYLRQNFIKSPSYGMLYMQFDARLRKEQQEGRIAKIEPFDLMMTIVSLTVFTFLAMPVFQDLLAQTDEQVQAFVQHRKAEITRFVLKGLKP